MNTTVSHAIRNFIVQTEYTDIPAPITQRAKECILDCIGVTLYGQDLRHLVWHGGWLRG